MSEIYEVSDIWLSDQCTSNKGHWTNPNILSFNSDGMLATDETTLDISYPTNFCLEVTLTEPSNPSSWTGAMHCYGVGFVGEGNTSYWYNDNVQNSYITKYSGFKIMSNVKIKFIVENGRTSIYYNDTFVREESSMTTAKFVLLGSPVNNYYLRIKDLTIKEL